MKYAILILAAACALGLAHAAPDTSLGAPSWQVARTNAGALGWKKSDTGRDSATGLVRAHFAYYFRQAQNGGGKTWRFAEHFARYDCKARTGVLYDTIYYDIDGRKVAQNYTPYAPQTPVDGNAALQPFFEPVCKFAKIPGLETAYGYTSDAFKRMKEIAAD